MAVLYWEVSLIQRPICTQLYVVGAADKVLIREESFIQSALYREVPLYYISTEIFVECCQVVVVRRDLIPTR